MTSGRKDAAWLCTLPTRDLAREFASLRCDARRGPYGVTFVGELDNRAELSRRLGTRADLDDAALAVAAYERWRDDAADWLRGAFVLVVVDRERETASVTRDQSGLLPCFYASTGDRIVVATTTRSLLRAGVSAELNRVALADRLCRRYPDPEETFLAHVRRLPPASRLTVVDGRLAVARYWDPWRRSLTPAPPTAEVFLDRLEQAVVRHGGGESCAISLSGGIDSVSVAAVAAAACGGRARLAVSVVRDDPAFDETTIQRGVAAALGFEAVEVPFGTAVRGVDPDAWRAINRQLSSPLANAWAPVYRAVLEAAASRRVRRVLTGSGADEWLSASPYYAADLLRRGRLLSLRRFVADWSRSHSPRGLVAGYGVRPLAGAALHTLLRHRWDRDRTRRLLASDPPWISPDPALRAAQRERAAAALGPASPPAGFVRAELDRTLAHSVSSLYLEEWYELEQATGARTRHPYLDVDVIEFAARLPLDALNHGGWLKGFARAFVNARLPTLAIGAQRKMLPTALDATIADRVQTLPSHERQFPTLAAHGIVDSSRLSARPLDGADGRSVSQRWQLVSAEMWAASLGDPMIAAHGTGQ